jgi:hypothetical protein
MSVLKELLWASLWTLTIYSVTYLAILGLLEMVP